MENSQEINQNQAAGSQNEDVLMALKDLIEICHTGHEGYTTAAESIESPEYKALLNSFSSQRHSFEDELKQCVQRLGGQPESESAGGLLTDAAGALHRGWINIKSVVTGGKDHAILDECERGEDAAVAAYRKALELQLPTEVAETVRQQYESVLEAHNRIKGLRNIEA